MTLFSQRHGTITSAAICNTFTTHALVNYGTLGVHKSVAGKTNQLIVNGTVGIPPSSKLTKGGRAERQREARISVIRQSSDHHGCG